MLFKQSGDRACDQQETKEQHNGYKHDVASPIREVVPAAYQYQADKNHRHRADR